MARTISAGLADKLAVSGKKLAKMLRLERTDGTILTYTNHDEDLVYDLVGDGDETYVASAIQFSDISFSAGLDPDNCEATGPFDEAITLVGVLGNRFQGARAWIFEVDWSDLTLGEIPLLGGQVSESKAQGRKWLFDIRDWRERLAQSPGRAMMNTCDAEHTLPVDPRCGRTPETDTATVVSAVDGMQMTVTLATGGWADGYFNKGEVLGLTGENEGIKLKIEDYDSATLVIKLFGFLPATPQAGDTFTLIRGCGKTRADCMARNNMPQFKGEPDSPGTDQLFRAAIPGGGDG